MRRPTNLGLTPSNCLRVADGCVCPIRCCGPILQSSPNPRARSALRSDLFTRLAALTIWIEMGVIIVFFQWQFGYFWTAKGYEYALLWWLICLAIFFRGGGRYAVDRLIGKEF